MDIEEDQFHEPSSTERRLRLRKDYKEKSIDNKTHQSDYSKNESNENDIAGISQSSREDDSILDFKSPERIYPVQSKIAKDTKSPNKSKKKILNSKPKIINNKKNLKNSKSLQRRNIAHGIQQPSIESSFFKSEKKETDSPQSDSTNTKTAYVCPLCFKNLKDESVQATHMKNCAIKNNVSTKKLMDAVELQERQAAERKSLGLLAAPVLQDKKKPAPRKITSHDDPDLQLALALSKSLYEKEEMEKWDEVQIVAISSGSSLPDNNTDCRQKTMLQDFGFTSDRSAPSLNNWPVNKIKRRKPLEPTILQRRTAVERERILTERIAEILMDCRDFTQKVQKEEESDNIKERIHIKSQLLQQLHQTEDTLWEKTKLTSTQNAFYVQQLSPQIIPSEKEEQKLNKERGVVQLIGQNINNEKTLDNEEMQTVKTTDSDEGLTISSNAVNICCKEKKFLYSLATSWRNVLNDSSISDVIIFVRNNRHIWAHKLIFYVRCTNVLLDIVSNDDTMFSTAKEKIDWFDTDYDVALAFLEFVYCGVIDKHSKILNSDVSLSGVKSLARKYRVNDLFAYLRQKEFKSVVAEVEHDYNTCEKSTGNVRANVEIASNVPKVDKSAFDASSNYTHDALKNIQSPQKTLLQEDVNDNIHSLEDSCTSTNSCLLQDKEAVSISEKLSEELNLRSNRSINRETSASPDMFDDTLDVTKHSDTHIVHSKDHEDSNIHMLLSLIKQDVDAGICSQRLLTRKTRSAECLDLNKDVSTRSKSMEQGIMEIDSDFESIDDKNSLTTTPQNSKSRCTQDPSYVTKQKSNLTLFIEKMQRENARSDSDLDSDVECLVQISPVIAKNPFHVNKHDDCEEPQSHTDNIEQLDDVKKKSSRLSIIEQRIRSYANKNPEFYFRPFNEHVEDVKQTSHMSPVSSKGTTESSDSNYTQSFTSPDEKGTNSPEQADKSSTVYSLCTKTTKRSFSETISDLEMKEEELSMYSKYMRDCKDNSIAKYREAIVKSGSVSDLSNKDASDSSDKKSDIDKAENDEALSRSILTQKDAEVIVSDTEIESISSDISCRVILQNNDRDDANISSHSVKWSRETTRDSKQDVESEGSDQSLGVEKISKAATTETDKEKDINTTTNSSRDTFDSKNMETTADDIDFGIITQKKFSSSDDQEKESVPSPIMVPSSPDFLDVESASPDYLSTENCLPGTEHSGKSKPVADVHRKSAEFSFNFEQDIYLANVDVNRYEKHVLEKSQSASVLNLTEFKKGSVRRCSNINNDKNNKDNNTIANDISYCANLDRHAISMTQSSTCVRKFQRKSLSEGQINVNRLCNKEAPSAQASVQFNYSHWHNGNKNTKLKVIDKNVTPPPDCDRMSTPELHKEMKKYGLKLQKRSRAVKLLTHIYNELHPLVPVSEVTTGQEVTEVSSDDEEPPLKKRNVDCALEKSNEEDNDDKSLSSQDSDESISSVKGTISREMEFYETESLPVLENSSDITEAFTKLINFDKDLYNKILRYEPVNIEQLRSTLQTHGFKCKLSNLMSFLDEQCITFYMPEQSVRSRTRRKA